MSKSPNDFCRIPAKFTAEGAKNRAALEIDSKLIET